MMDTHSNNIINKLCNQLLLNHNHNITTRSLFGCIAICYKGVMFGQIKHNKLYLRCPSKYQAFFKQYSMVPFIFEAKGICKQLQYYQVPEQLWQHQQKLSEIIELVIKSTQQEQVEKYQMKELRLKDLPNITLSLERALLYSGIKNVASLRQLGIHHCFFKLKQNNKNISYKVLFALYAALSGSHVAILTEQEKNALILQYEQFIVTKNVDTAKLEK